MSAVSRYRQGGYGRYLTPLFWLVDLAVFNVVFAIALQVVDGLAMSTIRMMWIVLNMSYLAVLLRKRGMPVSHSSRAILLDKVFADSLIDVGLHALFFIALTEILSDSAVPLKLYLVYYGLTVVALPLCDVALRMIVKRYRRSGRNYIRTVIVGTNETALRVLDALKSDPGYGYRVLAFFDSQCPPDFQYGNLYAGNLDALADFVDEYAIDHIYYALPGPAADDIQRVIKIADDSGADFIYVPQVKAALGRGFNLRSVGSMPMLVARENPLKNPLNRGLKRGFDIIASTLFLVTIYPFVYIPVAIAIKISSPGPIYFKQQRTGYRGQSFDCLKFRTMRVNKSADTAQATADDPRKTRVGDFLRRTSLDELPQFINVLRGDMSIVGPRPHMLKHTEDYSKLIDRYMIRHVVKPGITGWAQVNGYRGVTDQLWKMERRVEYDVWYIENWTILLDAKIMVRTVLNAIQGDKNAY